MNDFHPALRGKKSSLQPGQIQYHRFVEEMKISNSRRHNDNNLLSSFFVVFICIWIFSPHFNSRKQVGLGGDKGGKKDTKEIKNRICLSSFMTQGIKYYFD
jgi:hypothetical protein